MSCMVNLSQARGKRIVLIKSMYSHRANHPPKDAVAIPIDHVIVVP